MKTETTITPEQLDQIDIDTAEIVFGTTKFLPKYDDVPDEYKHGRTKWNNLFNDMFFSGIESLEMEPKEGVDADKAWSVIQAHMRSWEPKHEHKEAGVAYMMSMLFSDAKWERSGKKQRR